MLEAKLADKEIRNEKRSMERAKRVIEKFKEYSLVVLQEPAFKLDEGLSGSLTP